MGTMESWGSSGVVGDLVSLSGGKLQGVVGAVAAEKSWEQWSRGGNEESWK